MTNCKSSAADNGRLSPSSRRPRPPPYFRKRIRLVENHLVAIEAAAPRGPRFESDRGLSSALKLNWSDPFYLMRRLGLH
jgi:hypothetical protein